MNAQSADPPEARPYDPLTEAKELLRSTRSGALATVTPEGFPFASLVTVATAPDASPILLLSRLAAHTRHLEADPRLSLLLARGGEGDPLAHPRLTMLGMAERIADPIRREAARARFLAKHPKAALYADFADFSFWRVAIERASLNGGFGRAASFEGASLTTALGDADVLVAGEAEALAHLNTDHRNVLALYATMLAGAPEGDWHASGLDPEGLDLACGDRTARIDFPCPVRTPEALQRTLMEIAARARAGAASRAAEPH